MIPASDVQSPKLQTKWTTAIFAGGLILTDNADSLIVNPKASITGATRRAISLPPSATTVFLRMKYDVGVTVSVNPVVNLFAFDGDPNNADPVGFMALSPNGPGGTSITIEANPDLDATDGTHHYGAYASTRVSALFGHSHLLIGVQTAAAASVGSFASASLEIKIY